MRHGNNFQMEFIDTIISRGGLNAARYHVQINPDFVSIQNITSVVSQEIKFKAEEVTGYRYGITWIRGLEFPIGLKFQVLIQNRNNQEIKIIARSFYGFGKARLTELFNNILKVSWNCFFDSKFQNMLNEFKNGNDIRIHNLIINKIGVLIQPKGKAIIWDDLDIREYRTYFSISSKSNPAFANASFYYLKDWNTNLYSNFITTIARSPEFTSA